MQDLIVTSGLILEVMPLLLKSPENLFSINYLLGVWQHEQITVIITFYFKLLTRAQTQTVLM